MSFLDLPKKSKSNKQEKDLADRLGGKATPGSGNKRIKGDVHTWNRQREDPFELPTTEMIEAKTTYRTQYTLKLDDLHKLEKEAEAANKRPVFVLELHDDSKLLFKNTEWALIPMDHYERLTAHLREDDE